MIFFLIPLVFLVFFVSAAVFGFFFFPADFVKPFVFVGGIDGARHQWSDSLSVRDGLCRNILGKSVGENRGRYGRNLHRGGSWRKTAITDNNMM